MGAAIRPVIVLDSEKFGHHDLTITQRRLDEIKNNPDLRREAFKSTSRRLLYKSDPKMAKRYVKGLQAIGIDLIIPNNPSL